MNKLLFCIALLFCALTINAQDILVTDDGDAIKAYNVEVATNKVYYTLDPKSEDSKSILKNKVLVWKKADGTKVILSQGTGNSTSLTQQPTSQPLDLTDFHGFLMEKGNRVFIPTNSSKDYEQAGQEYLKKRIQEIGFWKIVDTPDQAHFVLQYWVDLKGADRSLIYARTRNSYKSNPICSYNYSSWSNKAGEGSVVFAVDYTSENPNDNINAVDKMLKDWWFQKKYGYSTQFLDIKESKNYKEYVKKGLIIP